MKEDTARRSLSPAASEEVASLRRRICSLESKLSKLLEVHQDSLDLIRQYEARFAQLIKEGHPAQTNNNSTPNEPKHVQLSPTSAGSNCISPNPADEAQRAMPASSRRGPNPIEDASSNHRQRGEFNLLVESSLRRKSSDSSQVSKHVMSIRKSFSPTPRKSKRSRVIDMEDADSPDLLLFRANDEEGESPIATQPPVTIPPFSEPDFAMENQRPSNGSMMNTQSSIASLSRPYQEEIGSSSLFHSIGLTRGNRHGMDRDDHVPKAPSTPKGYWDMLTLPEDSEPKSPKVRLAQLGLFRPRFKKKANNGK